MASLLPEGKQSFTTSAGIPLVGGKLYTYDAGTNNPRQTFQDAAGLVPNTNPIILDARGEATVFWQGAYKVVLKDSLDSTIWTVDNVSGLTAADLSASSGAGMIGFLYAAVYAAGTIGKWIQDLATTTGAGFIGFLQAGVGAMLRTIQNKLQDTVTVFDYMTSAQIADVTNNAQTLDVGPAIRVAFATGKALRFPAGTYIVDADPASGFNDGGTTRYGYSLKVPSNITLIFEEGAIIKQKNGAQKWTRTVSFENATNVRVFGELRVDANLANVGAATNEHMHGVFLFNTTESYFERINSQNARGDNVFIGGTDENTCTKNVVIGSIRAIKAGRKNLVLQHWDDLYIGTADLDNTAGGAGSYAGGVPDNTDRHSLDLEPDAYAGTAWMRAYIGHLFTAGTGNDLTAGTTDTVARKCVLNIGVFRHVHQASPTVAAWTQYACTVNIEDMRITGLSGVAGTFQLIYSAYLNVGQAYIQGDTPTVNDQLMLFSVNTVNRPRVRIGQLHLVNSVGIGLENRDGDVWIGKFRSETAGIAFWNRGLSSTAGVYSDMVIDEVEMADVGQPLGAGYAFTHTIAGTQMPLTTVKRVRFSDSRTPKLNYICSVGGGAAAGLVVGQIENSTTVVNFQFVGVDKFYRIASGGGMPADFICTGTPEAMITAPVGSTARRTDGGAGTSFYVKQSGTGNTGWVGK